MLLETKENIIILEMGETICTLLRVKNSNIILNNNNIIVDEKIIKEKKY